MISSPLSLLVLITEIAIGGTDLPGTTVITHGYQWNGENPAWPRIMAIAIHNLYFANTGRIATTLEYNPDSGDWSS